MQLERGKVGGLLGEIFPYGALLLYVVQEVFIEVPLFQETCSAPKNSWLRACNFQPTVLVFANLPIYRNLIHDNISLAVENQESFV